MVGASKTEHKGHGHLRLLWRRPPWRRGCCLPSRGAHPPPLRRRAGAAAAGSPRVGLEGRVLQAGTGRGDSLPACSEAVMEPDPGGWMLHAAGKQGNGGALGRAQLQHITREEARRP